MDFYMDVGPQYMEPIARQLHQEIDLVEEEHVTPYESLVDPGDILAPELPNVLTFEENKQFVRGLLDTRMDLTTLGTGYVRDAHERFERLREQIHGGEEPPSERVMAGTASCDADVVATSAEPPSGTWCGCRPRTRRPRRRSCPVRTTWIRTTPSSCPSC